THAGGHCDRRELAAPAAPRRAPLARSLPPHRRARRVACWPRPRRTARRAWVWAPISRRAAAAVARPMADSAAVLRSLRRIRLSQVPLRPDALPPDPAIAVEEDPISRSVTPQPLPFVALATVIEEKPVPLSIVGHPSIRGRYADGATLE